MADLIVMDIPFMQITIKRTAKAINKSVVYLSSKPKNIKNNELHQRERSSRGVKFNEY